MSSKILVLNGESYAKALKGFGEITTDLSDFLREPWNFRCVMFTGGEDVTPELYDDFSPKNICGYNRSRDKVETEVFNLCKKHTVAMTGICRGSQFLNVMSGGKLIHHLDGHAGSNHLMSTYVQEDPILVNSLHHQAIITGPGVHIVGWSTKRLSKKYIGYMDKHFDYQDKEVEAIVVPEHDIFAVQYHPEMMLEDSTGYIFYNAGLTMFLEMGADKFLKEFKCGENHGSVQA
jgi:gamma-glutamyl-gamma-aminobutyrate hydrolase PuuD